MMPVRHQVLLRLLFACALPLLAAPGHAAAQFELEKVVELSRHGIRPPTPGNREAIDAATQRSWPQWTTRDGELTGHGYAAVVNKGREEGVRFFVERNGSNPLEVASEVDRYCSWVGQACGYKVGHSEIVRQRGRAQTALGAKYDLRDFDDTVVLGGNVPLDVLAKNVDEYIAETKG